MGSIHGGRGRSRLSRVGHLGYDGGLRLGGWEMSIESGHLIRYHQCTLAGVHFSTSCKEGRECDEM